ncbi:hypothetical protein ACFPYN_12635 [Paenisporosarcina macmurdoensis]|uniref:Uncharacterized protein n=1 Tax=Paenisporosarcina macmurdoensis TaxID=212659 RepID=A0ABW1L8F0_9BACL
MVKPSGYEIPNGKRKSTVITSNDKGIVIIKKVTFDCFQIKDIQIDFRTNKCSFTCDEQFGKEMAATVQTDLLGFFIQDDEKSIAYFTYRQPKA